MKTIIRDINGDKLKVRDYKVDISEGEKVRWGDKNAQVKETYYDASIDAKIIVLDIDVDPKDVNQNDIAQSI